MVRAMVRFGKATSQHHQMETILSEVSLTINSVSFCLTDTDQLSFPLHL